MRPVRTIGVLVAPDNRAEPEIPSLDRLQPAAIDRSDPDDSARTQGLLEEPGLLAR